MKPKFLIAFLAVIILSGASRKCAFSQTGYPFLSHFSFNEDIDYDNFDFTLDNHRNIIIANRKGIITFDSRNWQLIPVAGLPTVVVNDPFTDVVFVGTRQGFGYTSRNETGLYEYQPIVNYDSVFETECIYNLPDKVFFAGKHEIRYVQKENNREVASWKFEENNPVQGAFIHGNDLYFILGKTGLMKTDEDTFNVVRSDPFTRKLNILCSAKCDSLKTLIATADNQVYIFDGHGFKDLFLECSTYINESILTGIASLNNGEIALSTLMGGCVIADPVTGKTGYIINSRTGLPDDEIFAMKTDNNNGLWLCHTKGLSRVDLQLPVTEFSFFSGLEGDLLSVAWFSNSLYAGTTEGLFRLSEKRQYKEKIITVKVLPKPAPVEEPEPESGSGISESDDEIDLRSLRKAQRKERIAARKSQPGTGILGSLIQKITESSGEKTQQEKTSPLPAKTRNARKPPDEFKKTRIYDLQSISHVYSKIDRIKGKCKDLVVVNNRLLASTNNGLFEIRDEKAFPVLADQYITFLEKGDDDNTVYAGTDEGALALQCTGTGWNTIADFRNLGISVYSLARTSDTIWYLGSDNLVWKIKTGKGKIIDVPGQYKLDLEYSEQVKIKIINDTVNLFLSSSVWQLQDSVFIRTRDFPGIYSIPRYFLNNRTIWLLSDYRWEQYGTQDRDDFTGILNIFSNIQYISEGKQNDLWVVNNNKEVLHLSSHLPDTSRTFDAYVSAVSGDKKYVPLLMPEIKHRNSSLKIAFSAPWYISPAKTEFRYYLEGLNKDWSDWSYSSTVEYPLIPPGNYRLFVQARNSSGHTSNEVSFEFTVKPPFWQTAWFKILAAIAVICIFILIMQLRQRSLVKAKKILEEKVRQRTKEIERQKNEIAEQKQEITDSIHYARQIQRAVLPAENIPIKNISGHFILFLPRDIVSGDFYWHRTFKNKTVIVAADCTGHGVPGAFMSMLGVSLLNEIVPESGLDNAAAILNSLRDHVNDTLSLSGGQEHARDGMDITLCIIDGKNGTLDFAGANNPLYILKNNELTEIKGDKMPVGHYEKKDPFTNHRINIKPGEVFYIFSDGFVDQFGGPDGKKYLSRNFRKFILDHHSRTMQEQKHLLLEEYQRWKGSCYQIDDILIVGFRI